MPIIAIVNKEPNSNMNLYDTFSGIFDLVGLTEPPTPLTTFSSIITKIGCGIAAVDDESP